jgi:plastocyanin
VPVRRLAPLAVVFVLAACGGGSDGSSDARAAAHAATSTTAAATTGSHDATTAASAPTTTAPVPASASPTNTTSAATPTTVKVAASPTTTAAAAPTTAAPRPTTTQPAPAAGPVSVAIANFVYSPDPVHLRAGSSVTWTNNDSAPHTATDDAHAWDTGSLAQGQSATVRFDTPGTYTYHCTLHPTMMGRIVVAG